MCRPHANGELSADVDGLTDGYEFFWYVGKQVKPFPDFEGAMVSNMSEGYYTVIAIDENGVSYGPLTVFLNVYYDLVGASIDGIYDPTYCRDTLFIA